jgi:lipoyl(octanoyl) transferase
MFSNFGSSSFMCAVVEVSDEPRRALKEETAMDEIAVMLQQETSRYPNAFNYLSFACKDGSAPSSDRVSEGWRRKICEWSFEVVDHFGFDREVVSVALAFLDRVVALQTQPTGEPMHRRDFQLVAVTSLYLAIKLHGETDTVDGPRRKLKIQAFVELSRGLFSVETLEAKEREVLKMLQWNVNPPTTVRIASTLLRLLPEWTVYENLTAHSSSATAIYEMARYLTELAVCVSTFSFNYKSSEVAYASILCAMDALQNRISIPYEVRVSFMKLVTQATGMTPQQVAPVRTLLMELCPSMFTRSTKTAFTRSDSTASAPDDAAPAEQDGKISPVCVMDQCRREEVSPRKRGRHQG